MSNSLQPHEWYSPWNSPGQNTGVGGHSLLQEIFPTQGSNSGVPHCSWILYQLSHQGNRNHFNYSIYSTQNPMLYTGLRSRGCESWTVKKAEHQRIDAFELWGWRRLLRVPWTARRSTQSILEEISPGCSLEGMMLKLKLQYFGHLMRRVDSLLGGIGGRRRRGRQRTRWLDGITNLMDVSLS